MRRCICSRGDWVRLRHSFLAGDGHLRKFPPDMQWIAPSEKDTASATLEKQLWAPADQLCANSGLKAAENPAYVPGLIFCASPRPAWTACST